MYEPHKALVRLGLVIGTVALLVAGVGFLVRAPWALALWPLKEGPLSSTFIASVLLAQATTMAWTAATLELNYARGGVVGYIAMNLGFVAFAALRHRETGDPLMLGWMIVSGLLAVNSVVLLILAGRYPKRDSRPVPAFARWSFLLFALVLVVVATMLIRRAPVVFPWPLKPESSVLFGLFFFASTAYLFDGWWRPAMGNALGQLAAFFVYDLVLIPPYLRHWEKAEGGFKISLAIYMTVLLWSALLAVWIWGRHLRRSPRAVSGTATA